MTLLRLRNPIRNYAWGSRTALAELTGRAAPTAEPEAELWMGAHRAAPSQVEVRSGLVSLPDWIRRDPLASLGAEAARRFGGELPFLLKVLACDAPLSLQVHPDAGQARRGFERENAAGLALDDPKRSYRDPHPKPELVCALTPFRALCGFRELAEIGARFEALEVPELTERMRALAGDDERSRLESLFTSLYAAPPEDRAGLARAVAEAVARRSAGDLACAWAAELARQYPGDVGVLAPLLLNTVELAPGEALFLSPGELHSYLSGVAVEVMASSDNVLRGGLTPKHVDVPELLATLSFRAGPPSRVEPRPLAPGVGVYHTPNAHFVLSVLSPSAESPVESVGSGSVEILLCVRGDAEVRDRGGEGLMLRRGESALVPAGAAGYRVTGEALLYRAGVPR